MAPDCIEKLRTAVASGALNSRDRAAARRLITTLSQPARIAVIGRRGAGKTSVVNMLAGATLMPETDGLTITELCYRTPEKMTCEYANGDVVDFDGIPDDFTLPEQAMRLRFDLPEPALATRTYIEVTLPDVPEMARDVLEMVAAQVDLALWCSPSPSQADAQLWQVVPDQLKDHSFFVLTHADRAGKAGHLDALMHRAQTRFDGAFLGIYPLVAATAAQAALAPDHAGSVLWRTSGARALVRDVERTILLSRKSDEGTAAALLDRVDTVCAPATASDLTNTLTAILSRTSGELSAADMKKTHHEVIETCRKAVKSMIDALPVDAPVGSAPERLHTEFSDASTRLRNLIQFPADASARQAVAIILQLNRELYGRIHA
ncbi:hypothetical protein [uncultured Roseobacter sp.]|uniref:hypothetical protein n=1 Tax=uncultured Roseobacter sp. TaxID=114847 RepID=UPI00260DCFAA|nr:hypothetical protein [uncultured Roseobacter sp.]